MMKLGPVIWMFSKTRAPDCAISVLIAERTAGLTWPWMSLATVNPFPSAITEPRMPFVFRRNSLRIFPSCPSMPSSEKLERAAFRRDSLRCIPVPPGPVEDRGLFEEHRATGVRLLHETEQCAFRRPDDEEEFVGPVPHAAQPDDQQPGSDRRGEAEGNCGSANQDGERDEPEGKRTEEPLDPLFHDKHPGPPDVFVHAREGEERHGEETRDGPEECEEADDNPKVCHGWSNARLRIACFRPIYLSLPMFSFVINFRRRADCASPDNRSQSLGTRAVVDRRGRSRLERLTAFPAERSVFHFEVAAISTLDLHHFLRRRRIDSRHGGCPAGGGESLLHVCIQSVGRHSRPAPHGASASAHGGGHERAAEHRPSQPDQGETESPNREGEIPASGTDQPGHVAAGIRRWADVRVELTRDVGRIPEDDETGSDQDESKHDHPATMARPSPLRAYRSF